MKKIISRQRLKFAAFVLSYFLTIRSIAQDKALDLSYTDQQTSTYKINFQRDLEKPLILFPDTLPRRSNVTLVRNEHAGIWKKIGRAELIVGGVEVIGITVLILLPKEITKWSDDWAQDA